MSAQSARLALMHALVDTRPFVGTPCPYCGGRMQRSPSRAAIRSDLEVSRDHFIPIARGGSDTLRNLLVVCRGCNALKGDLLPTEWLEMLLADGDPRACRVGAILERLPRLRSRCEAVEVRERAAVEFFA